MKRTTTEASRHVRALRVTLANENGLGRNMGLGGLISSQLSWESERVGFIEALACKTPPSEEEKRLGARLSALRRADLVPPTKENAVRKLRRSIDLVRTRKAYTSLREDRIRNNPPGEAMTLEVTFDYKLYEKTREERTRAEGPADHPSGRTQPCLTPKPNTSDESRRRAVSDSI